MSKNILEIYCDGACSGNPGEAGSGLAIYGSSGKPTLLYGAYIEEGTNNVAELNALLKALQIAYANRDRYSQITIKSDSKYSINCTTKWACGWAKQGWQRKGGEIKNLELIQRVFKGYNLMKDKLNIEYVKAHAGEEGNELADKMARFAIEQKNSKYLTYQEN